MKMNEMTEQWLKLGKKKIEDADYVAVGLGPEFRMPEEWEEEMFSPLFASHIHNRQELETVLDGKEYRQWIIRALRQYYIRMHPERVHELYGPLVSLLAGKDYFIVSTQTDGLVYQSGLDVSRIVTPCGREDRFQCRENCRDNVWENAEEIRRIMEGILEGRGQDVLEHPPVCPDCGERAAFHVRDGNCRYREEEYLPQWQVYTRWIQNTLNRQTMMLELGENFGQPTVMRWPFEKMAFLNRKACLLRINSTLYQIPEEAAERGTGLQADPAVFVKQLADTVTL